VSLKDRVLLLHNEKDGKFKDVSEAAGIKSDAFAAGSNIGLTFVDYDHDGDIDLYVSRYSSDTLFDPRKSALDAKATKVAGATIMSATCSGDIHGKSRRTWRAGKRPQFRGGRI